MTWPELFLVRKNLVLRLEAERGVIGSRTGPGIQTLLNEFVSGRHIGWQRLDAESIEVEDLGSTNGTHIGGRRIPPGSHVRVGIGGRVDFGRAGEWVLTDQAHRKATFINGAPRALLRELPHSKAEVQIRAGGSVVTTLRLMQASTVLYLAHEAGLMEEPGSLPESEGWLRRSELAEGLYGDRADVMRLNNVLARLRRKLDKHGLPDLVESQPGGGRPAPWSTSEGTIRIRLDGAWEFSPWAEEGQPRG